MSGKIKADVLQALDDWRAGKPLRVPELGHVHAMKFSEEEMQAHPNRRQEVDLSKRVENDQQRIYTYCFALIDEVNGGFSNMILASHDRFSEMCQIVREKFTDLVISEAEAAESLAWKALLLGWKRAIAGHGEERYIEVRNPAAAVAK